MRDLSDTICALSTPPGRSGIAVVRLSGPQTFSLVGRIFVTGSGYKQLPARRAMLGRVVDPRNGSEIDEAIATCFESGGSYTGEDMCEFSLHGSPVLISALLDCLCAYGARLAEPGEFTMRAYLRGRIDLAQAEAVRDIIAATTLYQAQIAARQRSGALSRQLQPLKESLIGAVVNLESAVEFADEDLPVASRESIVRQLEDLRGQLKAWIQTFRRGRIIRDGFSMAIVGGPNVGKSSLFNALLAQNRSIVAEIPGTTRDLVSEVTNLGGVPVRLHDTAGIHNSDSYIERLGIDRSMQAIADADAVLHVADTSRPLLDQELALKEQLRDIHSIAVMNKSDLPSCWSPRERNEFAAGRPRAEVSAKTLSRIDALRTMIFEHILGPGGMTQEGILVTNLRHCRNLEEAEQGLESAGSALQAGLSEEFALADLHRALGKLGEITGETGVDDILSGIFSQFCVGK